eukprot:4548131-Amphidinium_carterae.1
MLNVAWVWSWGMDASFPDLSMSSYNATMVSKTQRVDAIILGRSDGMSPWGITDSTTYKTIAIQIATTIFQRAFYSKSTTLRAVTIKVSQSSTLHL